MAVRSPRVRNRTGALRRGLLLSVVSGMGLVTCRTGPAVEPQVAGPMVTATAPAPTSPLDVPVLQDAATRAEDEGDEAPRVVTDAKVFGCGTSKCRAGEESCCGTSSSGVCVPTVPPGPKYKAKVLAAQLDACAKAKPPSSFVEILRCDESIDCTEREVCCEQLLSDNGSAALCVAQAKPGDTQCDLGERCVEGSPCRLPGTVCTRGYCKKPVTDLRCGKATCGQAAPACCGVPPTCQPESKCPDVGRFACARPSDCIPTEHCQLSTGGTACVGQIDIINTQLVCERDADCPDVCLGRPRAKTRCLQSEVEGIMTCQCQ